MKATECSSDKLSASVEKLSETSNDSSAMIDTQDAFVTVQTKDGVSSQKIPLHQFLEKVVGVKLDTNLQLNVASLLASSSCTENKEWSGDDHKIEDVKNLKVIALPEAERKSLEAETNESKPTFTRTQDKEAAELKLSHLKDAVEHDQMKLPRGRGRPRKSKAKEISISENISLKSTSEICEKNDDSSVYSKKDIDKRTASNCSTDAKQTNSADPSSTSVSTLPCPRRSRRTPARNSKFKDDFVDSSTLWCRNSSSSSWNTQLMTLALAAERHDSQLSETEENQIDSTNSSGAKVVNLISRPNGMLKRGAQSSESDSRASKISKFSSDIDNDEVEVRNTISELTKECLDNSVLDKEKLKSLNGEYVPSSKKCLKAALNLAVKNTQKYLCTKTPTSGSGDQKSYLSMPIYEIMDPKSVAKGDGLLVMKSKNGMSFAVADISGNDQSSFSSDAYPQDRLFACDSCDSLFTSASLLLSHNINCHSNTNINTNIVESLGKSESFIRDVVSCPVCEVKFPFPFMLNNHLEKGLHDDHHNNSHYCKHCNKVFSSEKDKKEHSVLVHMIHDCSLCGKFFDNFITLRRHMKTVCALEIKNIQIQTDDNIHSDDESIGINPISKKQKITEIQSLPEDMLSLKVDKSNKEKLSSSVTGTKSVFEKIPCDLCDVTFSTYSGLWHHKLDVHQQYYPPGFKDKILERLEKTTSLLRTTQAHQASKTMTTSPESTKRNKYYAVMHPKWMKSKSQINFSIVNKDFQFYASDGSSNNVANIKSDVDTNNSNTSKTETVSNFKMSDMFLPHEVNNDKTLKRIQFDCKKCVQSFQCASMYREHCSRKHGECFESIRCLGAFSCTQCLDTFPYHFMLAEHRKLHKSQRPLPCTLCKKVFFHIQDRYQHWKEAHPGIGCPNCGKMYASLKYLQKHISLNCQDQKTVSTSTISLSSEDCERHSIEDKETHKENKRVEKKILKCHLCPKICTSIHCWRRHMSENHEDDGFSKLSNECFICKKVFHGHKTFEKHLLQEHAEESGLPIEEESSIVNEALKKSNMDIVDYQKVGRDNDKLMQDDEGLFHCPDCPKTHPDLKAMLTHLKTHVNMQLECSVCKKTFKNPTLLRQHVVRHRTKAVYSCDTCNKKFVTLQKLDKHSKVHQTKQTFVCELCGMSFALNDYLLKHKKSHTKNRPHSCSVCGKSFRTRPELRVHVLIHTQETPYVCDHCGRGFTQKGNWRIHLAQHTGHKPHKCDQCDLSFALPSHLKRHMITHNQKINYRCVWCDKECTQRKHMQMHVARIHKEDFFQFEEQMKLEVPVDIAPSQMKMYNRRINKGGQVRRAYRSQAKKCNTGSDDIMRGVTKAEIVLEDDFEPDNSEMITLETVIGEPLVEGINLNINSNNHHHHHHHLDLTAAGQEIITDGTISSSGGYQILVSDGGVDHQSYIKHDVHTDTDPTTMISSAVAGEMINVADVGDGSSNVQIVMGDNNEINIIINNSNGDHQTLTAVEEALEQHGHIVVASTSPSAAEVEVEVPLALSHFAVPESDHSSTDLLAVPNL